MKTVEETTKDLIRFKTVEGNAQELGNCLNYIEGQLDSGLDFQRFEKNDEKSVLISRGENPRILLHGHLDVIGAEDEIFEPEVENGRIYGRGAADMKSGVACMMKVLEGLEDEDVALLLTSDEERGGFNGTGYVIDEADLEPEFVVSGEPDDSGSFPSIVTRQKGVLQLEISTEGKSAHSSKPEKGENAAEKLLEKYQEIRENFDHEKNFSTTINLGKISSEGPVNKIPNKASVQLDIRFSNQYPRDQVLEDIEGIEGIDTEILKEAPMMEADEDNVFVQGLRSSAEEVSGQAGFRRENFASDMRFFTERGIPAVCFGPEGYDLHGENEYVEIESMEQYCKILQTFLEEVSDGF
ncbi:MAG: M20 family metallopeptidase [Candidatus Nanohaloarchaea archaeon]